MTAPYGGISRADRIEEDDGPWCDKAWHLDYDRPVRATAVLSCAFCGRRYARCAECNRGQTSAAYSMAAHMRGCKGRYRL